MASGKENRDDPLEDDDARLVAGLKKQDPPTGSSSFYQSPLGDTDEDTRYQPEEKSFFSRSPEERAEQAKRAAQRVRRRTPEEDFDGNDVSDVAPVEASEPAIENEAKEASAPQRSTEQTSFADGSDDAAQPDTPPSDDASSLLDRAMQVPAPVPVSQPSTPSNEQSGSDRKSLADRAAALAETVKGKAVVAEAAVPKVEKPSTSGSSLMDRMVDRPKETEPSDAKDANSDKSASLMDRAMEQSTPDAKPSPTFEPKAVLSAPPKPAERGPAARAERKAAGRLKTVVAAGSARATSALAKKAAAAGPLAERMKNLAKTKSAAEVLAERAEPSAEPRPKPKSSSQQSTQKEFTPEEAVFAAPPMNPKARKPQKPEPPVAPEPKPTSRNVVAATEPLAAAPAVPVPVAAEPTHADRAIVTPTSGLRSAKTKPFAPFEWMIAGRYLGARKKEGFVSVIAGFSLVGIALGVATLIVVMAVMTGFRETLITQIIGGSPHINVYSQSDRFENYDTLADQIRAVDGVINVTPVVQGQVLGTAKRNHSGVIVRGMRKADLEQLIANAAPEVIKGDLNDFVEDKGVALGADLAAKLGLRVGDFITLISPDGDITPFQATPLPRVKDYRIVQTFKLGVQEIDYNVAFMPFEEAQIYFNKQNQADTLDVFVDDPQSVSANLAKIGPGSYEDNIFRSARSSISVNNWKNLNGRLIGAINLERQVMFVILTMIILVAALNIISGLVMLVKDKARDVAILRTMGMARGSILRIFFICGSSIGVIGSIAGVVLGVLFVWNIHAIQGFVEWVTGTQVWDPSVRAGITEIPTKLQFSDVTLTLFIALGLSFIATLFPAWKAAKLDPVEALRYE